MLKNLKNRISLILLIFVFSNANAQTSGSIEKEWTNDNYSWVCFSSDGNAVIFNAKYSYRLYTDTLRLTTTYYVMEDELPHYTHVNFRVIKLTDDSLWIGPMDAVSLNYLKNGIIKFYDEKLRKKIARFRKIYYYSFEGYTGAEIVIRINKNGKCRIKGDLDIEEKYKGEFEYKLNEIQLKKINDLCNNFSPDLYHSSKIKIRTTNLSKSELVVKFKKGKKVQNSYFFTGELVNYLEELYKTVKLKKK